MPKLTRLPKRSKAAEQVDEPHKADCYIGIDPGAGGGIAQLRGRDAYVETMPKTEADLWEALRYAGSWSINHGAATNPFAIIEQVGGYTKAGGPQPGSAMFKFGQNYGAIRMALIGNRIPFDEVSPQTWQNKLGIAKRGKSESKGQFKNRLKAKAQQLFPNRKVTLAVADALLIAEYCRRLREGKL